MQRTGRKGYATFRMIVQDSKFSPTSGRVVANLGHYNPHTKETVIDTEKVTEYLNNGAQPSPRVVKLLKDQKVKLPSWVEELDTKKEGKIRNPEKLRKHQPAEEAPAEEPAEEPAAEAEAPAEEAPAEEPKAEAESGSDEDTSTTAESAPEEAPAEEAEATEEKPE